MDKHLIGVVSGVINTIAIIPYVYGVARGRARPNRSTWIVWAFLSWTILLASINSGVNSTVFWLASAAFNATVIVILSFWRGYWEGTRLEISCLLVGLIGILVWYFTKDSDYGVYIGITVNLVAILPTVSKVWKDPTSEPIIAWSIGMFASILNVIAIDASKPVVFIPPNSYTLAYPSANSYV